MFECSICKESSKRNEAPIVVLHEARRVAYLGAGTTGWEIVREGNVAPSHKHELMWDERRNRFVPSSGLELQ